MGTTVRPIRPGISISQKGFGAATGGTLGCFVEDAQSGKTMLLSNMHILQFYQVPTSLLGSLLGSVAEDPTQNEIVQPCGIDIKNLAEQRLGRDRRKVYQDRCTASSKLLPTEADLKEFYTKELNGDQDTLRIMYGGDV